MRSSRRSPGVEHLASGGGTPRRTARRAARSARLPRRGVQLAPWRDSPPPSIARSPRHPQAFRPSRDSGGSDPGGRGFRPGSNVPLQREVRGRFSRSSPPRRRRGRRAPIPATGTSPRAARSASAARMPSPTRGRVGGGGVRGGGALVEDRRRAPGTAARRVPRPISERAGARAPAAEGNGGPPRRGARAPTAAAARNARTAPDRPGGAPRRGGCDVRPARGAQAAKRRAGASSAPPDRPRDAFSENHPARGGFRPLADRSDRRSSRESISRRRLHRRGRAKAGRSARDARPATSPEPSRRNTGSARAGNTRRRAPPRLLRRGSLAPRGVLVRGRRRGKVHIPSLLPRHLRRVERAHRDPPESPKPGGCGRFRRRQPPPAPARTRRGSRGRLDELRALGRAAGSLLRSFRTVSRRLAPHRRERRRAMRPHCPPGPPSTAAKGSRGPSSGTGHAPQSPHVRLARNGTLLNISGT